MALADEIEDGQTGFLIERALDERDHVNSGRLAEIAHVRFWREADIQGRRASTALVANDPGCVKTHTSAKCRKHNSPARHRTWRVQYDLTLRDAIARRYFYAWRDRWSFRTAKTQRVTGPHPPNGGRAALRFRRRLGAVLDRI